MKIEAKKLKSLLDVVTIGGRVEAVVLRFEQTGLYANTKSKDNVSMAITHIEAGAFEGYKPMEKPVGLKDANLMRSLLGTFKGVINLDFSENMVTIFDKSKSANLMLAKPEFLNETNFKDVPETLEKFDGGVQVQTTIFTESNKNIATLKSEKILINVKDKVLNVEVGEKHSDKIIESVECAYKNVQAKFDAKIFSSITDVLKDTTTMSLLGDNQPIQFSYKDDNIVSRLIIAPCAPEDSPTPQVEAAPEPQVITGSIPKEEAVSSPEIQTEGVSDSDLL